MHEWQTNVQNVKAFHYASGSKTISRNLFRRVTVLTENVASTRQRSFYTPEFLQSPDQEGLPQTYNNFPIVPRSTGW